MWMWMGLKWSLVTGQMARPKQVSRRGARRRETVRDREKEYAWIWHFPWYARPASMGRRGRGPTVQASA